MPLIVFTTRQHRKFSSDLFFEKNTLINTLTVIAIRRLSSSHAMSNALILSYFEPHDRPSIGASHTSQIMVLFPSGVPTVWASVHGLLGRLPPTASQGAASLFEHRFSRMVPATLFALHRLLLGLHPTVLIWLSQLRLSDCACGYVLTRLRITPKFL